MFVFYLICLWAESSLVQLVKRQFGKKTLYILLWADIFSILKSYLFNMEEVLFYVKEAFCWIVSIKLDGWHSSELFGMGTTWT